MKISFNLRLSYSECQDCIKKIQELGGDGNVTVGGSWYTGTKEQIDKLLIYMGEKNYDLGSMVINEVPREATRSKFEDKYFAPSKESIEKCERAFNARLAYEKNYRAKYDYPDWMCKPSKPPIRGERMIDFAVKYNTTIEEMKGCELRVDRVLVNVQV